MPKPFISEWTKLNKGNHVSFALPPEIDPMRSHIQMFFRRPGQEQSYPCQLIVDDERGIYGVQLQISGPNEVRIQAGKDGAGVYWDNGNTVLVSDVEIKVIVDPFEHLLQAIS